VLDALQDTLLSVIYPQQCRVCSREVEDRVNGVACRDCWQATRIFAGDEMLCEKCGAFLGEAAAPVAARCHKCNEHHYHKAVAAGVYEKALAAAIVDLKTSPHLSKRMRSLISQGLTCVDLVGIELIVPVPLAKERYVERGFNQAEIIARAVAAAASLPVDTFSLARTVHTPLHRLGMDQRARELTVENAFAVARPKLVSGKAILLVDDVLTSGATASACAKVLTKNGANRVNVFTIARAVLR
jgi:ComF family protein